MTWNRRLATVLIATCACSASQHALADKKTDHTLIGVGIGALAGAMLSNGDPLAAIAGAAAGGAIGNIATGDDKRRGHDRNQGRDNDRFQERQRQQQIDRDRWERAHNYQRGDRR